MKKIDTTVKTRKVGLTQKINKQFRNVFIQDLFFICQTEKKPDLKKISTI